MGGTSPRTEEAIPARAPEAPPRSAPPGWPSVGYWVRVTIAVTLTVALLAVLRSISSILVLIVIALVIAIGMEPAIHFFTTRAKVRRRGVAVLIIFCIGLAVIGVFLSLVVPSLVRETNLLAGDLPKIIPRLEQRNDWIGSQISAHEQEIQDFISTLPQRLTGSFQTILSVTGKIGGIVFNLLTVAVLSIFFMLGLPRLRRSAVHLAAPEQRARTRLLLDRSIEKIGGYVAGNLATSAICAVAASVALFLIGLPFAVALGMWAGLADLIPAVGAYLGAIPAVVVGFSQGIVPGLLTLAYFIVYQQVENYLIVPRVMRNAVDMSSLAVLLSTIIGASLAGFAGALLAIPVAAILKVVLTDVWRTYRGEELEAPEPVVGGPREGA